MDNENMYKSLRRAKREIPLPRVLTGVHNKRSWKIMCAQ
ncbi:uncharacterized protein METZ01_LOCUS126141 [marine metagenome]|uniref:Uncharacterized protein n=1 Tax=marine metagenome TaxID=408172 RepID=A0A381YA39_9ZZZZ